MKRCLLVLVTVLGSLAHAGTATAAPTGRIVYDDAFGGSGIYTIDPDGSGRVRILDQADALRPVWSPDGSGIAFVRFDGKRWGRRIEWVDADGSNRHLLIGPKELPSDWRVGSLAWSPDGRRLALGMLKLGTGRNRIYIASRNGSTLDVVAKNAASPDWSSSDRLVAVIGGDLVSMDPDGGNRDVVLSTGDVDNPRWSPDGTRIVFMRHLEGLADVMVVDADGGGLANLTNTPHRYDWSPTFSPTGTHIVWSLGPKGDPYGYADLWRMRADGSAQTRLTKTKAIDEYEPDWIAVT